jgi:hypothetical protein
MLRFVILVGLALNAPLAAQPGAADPPIHTRAAEAAESYRLPSGIGTVWFDPKKWTLFEQAESKSAVFYYRDKLAEAYLFSSAADRDVESQLADLLERIGAQHGATRVRFKDTRRVNGSDMLCVQIIASSETIDRLFYGYLYSGEQGSIQFITITASTRAPRLYGYLTTLLDGLVIADSPTPAEPSP